MIYSLLIGNKEFALMTLRFTGKDITSASVGHGFDFSTLLTFACTNKPVSNGQKVKISILIILG